MEKTRYWLLAAIICIVIGGGALYWKTPTSPSREAIAQLEVKDSAVKLKAISVIANNKVIEATPKLIALVKDPEEQLDVQYAAIQALGVVGGEKNYAFLQGVLKDDLYPKELRASAAQGLSYSSDPSTAEVLIQVLNQASEFEVQFSILQALSFFKGPKTEEAILFFLDGDHDPGNKTVALEALLAINEDKALPLMVEDYKKSDNPKILKAYSQIFALKKHPATVDPLLDVLKTTDNEELKRMTIIALGEMRVDKALPEFVTILQTSQDPQTAIYAVSGLYLLGDKMAVDPLNEYYDKLKLEFDQYQPSKNEKEDKEFFSNNMQGRIAAMQSLAHLDLEGSIDLFKEAAITKFPNKGDKQHWIAARRVAMDALSASKDEGVDDFIIDQGFLNSDVLEIRLGAIQALGHRKTEKALAKIIKQTESGRVPVRRQAATSLGNFQDPQATTALIVLLNDKATIVAADALRSLIKLDDPRAIVAIEETAHNESANESLKRIAESLLAEREKTKKPTSQLSQ